MRFRVAGGTLPLPLNTLETVFRDNPQASAMSCMVTLLFATISTSRIFLKCKKGKSQEMDGFYESINVDSVGLRYSNSHLFNQDEFIDISLWRDSLNGVIIYGKW